MLFILCYHISSLLGLPEIRCTTVQCSTYCRIGVHHWKDQCQLLQLLFMALPYETAAAGLCR